MTSLLMYIAWLQKIASASKYLQGIDHVYRGPTYVQMPLVCSVPLYSLVSSTECCLTPQSRLPVNEQANQWLKNAKQSIPSWQGDTQKSNNRSRSPYPFSCPFRADIGWVGPVKNKVLFQTLNENSQWLLSKKGSNNFSFAPHNSFHNIQHIQRTFNILE